MTREEALTDLLKVVFNDRKTVYLGKDKILLYSKSLINDCRYNSKYSEKFSELFEYAFIVDAPKEAYSNSIRDFDRETAMKRAIEYFRKWNVNINPESSNEKKCKLIYEYISKYILKAIMTNLGNEDVKCAKDKDISAELLYAFSECTREIGLSYFNELTPSNEINKCKSEGFDEKNPSTVLKNHPYCFRSNNIIKRILGLSVNYPKECNEMPLIDDCDILNKLSSIDGIVVERMCISGYDYVSELSQLEQLELYINLSEKDFINIFKNKSLDSAVSTYSNEISTENSRTIINEYQKKANRLYEKACSYLETLTENIIKVSNQFKNNLSNDDNMNIFHEFVNSKLFDVVFNAGLLKLRIEISNSKEKCPDIMFTVLQDLIVNVTDLLGNSEETAKYFVDILGVERVEEHIKTIKSRINSNNLKFLCTLEKNYYKDHKEEFRTPETLKDIFICKKKNVMYRFKAALGSYIDELKKAIKNETNKLKTKEI